LVTEIVTRGAGTKTDHLHAFLDRLDDQLREIGPRDPHQPLIRLRNALGSGNRRAHPTVKVGVESVIVGSPVGETPQEPVEPPPGRAGLCHINWHRAHLPSVSESGEARTPEFAWHRRRWRRCGHARRAPLPSPGRSSYRALAW